MEQDKARSHYAWGHSYWLGQLAGNGQSPTRFTTCPIPTHPTHWTDWTLGVTALGKGPTPVKPYRPDHWLERGQSRGETGEVEGPR